MHYLNAQVWNKSFYFILMFAIVITNTIDLYVLLSFAILIINGVSVSSFE